MRAQCLFSHYNAMAIIRQETEGEAKVVVDVETGDPLGVHILSSQAGELIGDASLARYLEASARERGSDVHRRPSLSEALIDVAQLAARTSI